MLDLITQAQNLPFSVAIGIVGVLTLLQIIGAGDLLGADGDIDVDFDADGGMAIDSGLLSILGIGRVPMMVWLMVLLSVFGLLGFGAQQLLEAVTGTPWTAWLVGPAVGAVALPVTGAISRPLGALLPKDETSAIDRGLLVGREAEIEIGTSTPGSPARAKVSDQFGQVHHVMLEPDNTDQRFVQGERVLIVRREGELFKAIARGDHYLPKLG